MRVIAALGLFSLALLASCVLMRAAPVVPAEPPSLQFDGSRYDGRALAGRLLVRARTPFTLDRRLIEHVSVGVASVHDCASGQALPLVVADILPRPARDNELITLGAGEWFGREVHFLLFSEPFDPPVGPDCIDFELFLSVPEVQGPVATVKGRALRTEQPAARDPGIPAAALDGGTDAGPTTPPESSLGPASRAQEERKQQLRALGPRLDW